MKHFIKCFLNFDLPYISNTSSSSIVLVCSSKKKKKLKNKKFTDLLLVKWSPEQDIFI